MSGLGGQARCERDEHRDSRGRSSTSFQGSTLLRRSGAVDEQKDAVDDGRFSASGLQP
jgi:hypothetical protein